MKNFFEIEWVDPLKLAGGFCNSEDYISFLFSSLKDGSTQYSYLGVGLEKTENNIPDGDGYWFGYIPYDASGCSWVKHSSVYIWDHENHKLFVNGSYSDIYPLGTNTYLPFLIYNIKCSLDKDAYLDKFNLLREAILNGEIYQANLTRKWSGKFTSAPDSFGIFSKLISVSPSPYSAFIKRGDLSIISSSPEMFMKFSEDGKITCRPIKGTAPRGISKEEDLININRLKNNSKELAENLMITDLIRNDISISSVPDSVKVIKLQEIETYPTIFHMSSTITGTKLPHLGVADVLANSLPAGSMTGTPKIQAVKLLKKLEPVERGIYSGVLGWINSNKSAELSVIIRTLIINGLDFEFSAGGGIVADSEAESEYQETLLKATPIAKVLGISELK
jgi:para-aminobenzoate synthetase component I